MCSDELPFSLFRSAYSLSCIDIFASGFIRCACACQSVDVALICYTVAILPKQFGHFTMMFTMSEDPSPCLGRCSCSHRAEAQALARHRRFQTGVVPPFRDENHKKEALETLSKEAPSPPQSLSAWSNIPHAYMEEAKDVNWNGEVLVIELSRIICRP